MRHFRSLREYVEALREIGEIQEIDAEVDWNLELGAIVQRSYELGAPAPLFNRIKGIEAGFRALGAPAGVSRIHGLARIALSLGRPASATGCQLVEGLAEAHGRAPIPPRRVADGPCKQHKCLGPQVDLHRLPAPLIHAGDGGRYVNTWGTVIVQTPDRKWTNWSIARIMLAGRNTLTGLVLPRQHLGMIYTQWKQLGRPMPFALAIGTAPAIPFISAMPLADGVNEADFVGAYLGEPLEVVDCETVDLQVPATSEIVLEGTVSVEETACEGPIGEYTGYLNPGGAGPQPVFHVTAMTYRDQPILPVVASGEPIEENHTCWGLAISAQVLWELRAAGFPVTACFSPFQSAAHWLVVTVPGSYRGQGVAERLVGELARILCHSRAGALIPKAILLGDDIDPANLEEVVWAFATRCHPERGQFLFPNQEALALLAFLASSERQSRRSTKVIYHGLPLDDLPAEQLPRRCSFRHGVPPEIQEKVLRDWQGYGYRGG
jgi:4-hydroxy-3-polyprenylbenzoate decarboxylase